MLDCHYCMQRVCQHWLLRQLQCPMWQVLGDAGVLLAAEKADIVTDPGWGSADRNMAQMGHSQAALPDYWPVEVLGCAPLRAAMAEYLQQPEAGKQTDQALQKSLSDQ